MADSSSNKPIRVRMAPSPTGPLHIGTARMTLFDFLFARHMGGTFILRIEDTDPERSKVEHEISLIEGLHWLGLDWDEGPTFENGKLGSKGDYGPYRDSERIESHKKYIKKFLEEGKAYQCYCTKEELDMARQESEKKGVPFRYPGTCRDLTTAPAGKVPQVIRLKMPNETITFNDLVRGSVSFEASALDDFAIARADGSPLYNFSVAIDDYEMKITHVIRGEDHISNTPKQIAVYMALGIEPPIFGHTPLILNSDKSKMSKRSGDTSLADFRAKGYLPAAIINFLVLMGWHPKDDREVMTLNELIELFDIERVQKAGAVFNQEKLDWLNREYLKKLDDKGIAQLIVPMLRNEHPDILRQINISDDNALNTFLTNVVGAVRGRASTLADFIEMGNFFFALPDYEPSLLVWKNAAPETVVPVLSDLSKRIDAVPESGFMRETIEVLVAASVSDRPRGEVLWPLRVALSGQKASPDPIEILTVLGKTESLRRVEVAIQKFK